MRGCRWLLLPSALAIVCGNPVPAASDGSRVVDLIAGGAFLGLGVFGTVKASSAADDADTADERVELYAGYFLDDYTASAICYGAYQVDGQVADYDCYQSRLSSAATWALIVDGQAKIADDRRADENRWKGMSYVAYAAGGYILLKALLDSGPASSGQSRSALTPEVVPEVSPRYSGVELAWRY